MPRGPDRRPKRRPQVRRTLRAGPSFATNTAIAPGSLNYSFQAVLISESFVIADWTDPGTHPGRRIAGLHVHRSDDEAWFALEGRLGFQVGEEQREVGAGESILVARGTPHSYWNPAAAPARYLLVMTPRIHRLIEALHAGERRDFPAIFEQHDSELLA
jgi:mannose-6-phosphate isomerase-like protein (cupin superfamily)